MRDWPREVFLELEPSVRVRYCRSEPPPPIAYAVTLEFFAEGKWTTIALWDNADAFDEHHEHEYTRTEGKRPPTVLSFASVNEATAAAIRKATTQWRATLTTWSER